MVACSTDLVRPLQSTGRRSCCTFDGQCTSPCRLSGVGEHWHQRWRRPDKQVRGRSDIGIPRRQSWNRHAVVLVASEAVVVSVWCDHAAVHWLSSVATSCAATKLYVATNGLCEKLQSISYSWISGSVCYVWQYIGVLIGLTTELTRRGLNYGSYKYTFIRNKCRN